MYDFKAERPDELEAKEGEAIIVIAQSNPEWFVAKPITRLGGPGLIPVSFIEIRDMATGQAAEDPLAAVAKAGVPKVEEWKKMAADYKNGSIPLGKLTGGDVGGQQGLQQGMARMSMGNQSQNPYAEDFSITKRPTITNSQTDTAHQAASRETHIRTTRTAMVFKARLNPRKCWLPPRQLSHDTASPMTYSGLSSNALWKTAVNGNSNVSTKTSTTSKSTSSKNIP
jgi:hypothetical protein